MAVFALNAKVRFLSPPNNAAKPKTNSKFVTNPPTSESKTISYKPPVRAENEITNSTKLPNVELRMPPQLSPKCSAICSTDWLIIWARGTIAMPFTKKTIKGLIPWPW